MQRRNFVKTGMLATSGAFLINWTGCTDSAIVYEKTFTTGQDDVQYIDLGLVKGITELTLNGKSLGTRWYGTHLYDITDAVKKGENKFSVRLTTITGNYMKNLKDNAVAQRWTRNQPYHSIGILGPVHIF